MKFSILFDNYNFHRNLHSLWGFSCLIEFENQTILFDTGSNGRVLLSNAKLMGIDFKNIDTLFISHPHWDHIGGIDTIIEENPNINLILPNSLSKHYIKDLKKMVKQVIIIDENWTQLDNNIYSTGVMMPIGEQSMAIEKDGKLYIISGCGHAGIDIIESRILQNLPDKDVQYIIGGFHLLRSSTEQITHTINNINSKYISATHCTGDMAIGLIKKIYKQNFLPHGAGAIIEFNS